MKCIEESQSSSPGVDGGAGGGGGAGASCLMGTDSVHRMKRHMDGGDFAQMVNFM